MNTTHRSDWDARLNSIIEDHADRLRSEVERLIGDIATPVEMASDTASNPIHDSLTRLRESIASIQRADGQRDLAARLLDAAATQASRTALILARGACLTGYDCRGAIHGTGPLSSFQWTPAEGDPLGEAARAGRTLHLLGADLAGTSLGEWMGADLPLQACLAPVVVGDRTVAVLYADSGPEGSPGVSQFQPEAFDILASVAALSLDRLRPAAASPVPAAPAPAPPPPAAMPAAPRHAPLAATHAPASIPAPVPAPAPRPAPRHAVSMGTIPLSAPDPLPAPVPPPPSPDATVRLRVADLHEAADPRDDEARRFARLLASEISLYNEVQVRQGQQHADIGTRLREPIERSREAFRERCGAGPRERLFEAELVRALAQGDPALMGQDWPQG